MTFSYSITHASERDRVRSVINDKVEDEGPLPDDVNFSDEELDAIIAEEGSWQRAVANCLESLAAAWTRYPTFQADGIGISRSHITRNYSDEAQRWRKRYGYPRGTIIHTRSFIRVDGYSDDVASDEVDN